MLSATSKPIEWRRTHGGGARTRGGRKPPAASSSTPPLAPPSRALALDRWVPNGAVWVWVQAEEGAAVDDGAGAGAAGRAAAPRQVSSPPVPTDKSRLEAERGLGWVGRVQIKQERGAPDSAAAKAFVLEGTRSPCSLTTIGSPATQTQFGRRLCRSLSACLRAEGASVVCGSDGPCAGGGEPPHPPRRPSPRGAEPR